MADAREIRVIGLCGSLRPDSYTRMALRVALEGAARAGARTSMVDLQQFDLVFCAGHDEDVDYPPDVLRLRSLVRDAHGVLLGTPEYHGSFSGVLKNALDLMGFDELEGKMIGLVGVSGGRMGGVNALSSLRGISRALHAWVVPEQATVPQAWQAFGPDGLPLDGELTERLRTVGSQVARFAYLHSSEQAMEFLRRWESAPENPGGGEHDSR